MWKCFQLWKIDLFNFSQISQKEWCRHYFEFSQKMYVWSGAIHLPIYVSSTYSISLLVFEFTKSRGSIIIDQVLLDIKKRHFLCSRKRSFYYVSPSATEKRRPAVLSACLMLQSKHFSLYQNSVHFHLIIFPFL